MNTFSENEFCHVSMLIDLRMEPWTPVPQAYTHTSAYLPKRSRALVHESIHYWQQLSHGYVFRMAEEDWQQMLAWERGSRAGEGRFRRHFKEPEGEYGFSACDLCESFAQFWEVVFTGPAVTVELAQRSGALSEDVKAEWDDLIRDGLTDKAYDMAMRLAGRYYLPYAVARKVLDPAAGMVIFPFLAHFALKTSRPAHFFERFVEEVGPAAATKAQTEGLFESPPRAGVETLYVFVENHCVEVVERHGEPGLLHATELFASSPLRMNYVYWWSFRRLRRLSGRDSFDLAICLAARNRGLLAQQFAPPCLRFADLESIGLSHCFLKRIEGLPWLSLRAAEHAARASLELHARWKRFQDGSRQSAALTSG